MQSIETPSTPGLCLDQPPKKLHAKSLEEKKASFLKIEHVHTMPDFLMNLVSPQDQWMYITSNGALTAGRVDADNVLFPYYTQDKLIDLESTTGSLTHIRTLGNKPIRWTPFSKDRSHYSFINRTLYKSQEGNEVIFQEIHEQLGLQFSYLWTYSPKYGFVRQVELKNNSDRQIELQLLDGIHNIVPYGLDQGFLNRFSNLANAYKKSELVTPENVGIYYLSSIPTDRAEPSEGLKATVAWSIGYDADQTLISDNQTSNFIDGKPVSSEYDIRGIQGAYLVSKKLRLEPGESYTGLIVGDINQDAGQIEQLQVALRNPIELLQSLEDDIAAGQVDIENKLSSTDGYQLTGDSKRCARHLSNVLFNMMRGGVFYDNYAAPKQDFLLHLNSINTQISSRFESALNALPEHLEIRDLLNFANSQSDTDLLRITIEYLPLTFSRRHGDPSRPWNAFSIETTDEHGQPILAYQGNWRDIFQNWEALAYSYPGFIRGMIFRFLNASTRDGYNPYRLTKDGFDWEILEEDEPWSNIGYWGDHQIIYLLKLLELVDQVNPSQLTEYIDSPIFVYANVPYRIADFESIWNDPRDTVEFDTNAHQVISKRADQMGADGKLLLTENEAILKASLMEKLLIPLLAKLSNFVPEGGIWMNTQRPEWNDANNALVGNGLSVVTLGYIHRFLGFLIKFLKNEQLPEACSLSKETVEMLERQSEIFSDNSDKLEGSLSSSERYEITTALGQTGSRYRSNIYKEDNADTKSSIQISQVLAFTEIAESWIQHSLERNLRADGLFHSYNLLSKGDGTLAIDHLYEMLEGQVSILSAKYLRPDQAADLLDTLRQSDIYRKNRGTYMLYPNRDLPRFLEKNIVSEDLVESSALIQHLIASGENHLVYRDIKGQCRFNGSIKNAEDLRQQLESTKAGLLKDYEESDFVQLESIFSNTFNHESFTGRSGTFFAYEGLGSIYWHMVSKLVLAIQECCMDAKEKGANVEILRRLQDHYHESLEGLGINQSPEEYGAFPSDAYSHTPTQSGVQQPGMTGQVKEDILIRWNELGVLINESSIQFQPQTLKRTEFLNTQEPFSFTSIEGKKETILVEEDQLAFTYCQVPIIYRVAESNGVTIHHNNDKMVEQQSNQLSSSQTQSIFSRSGDITRIEVNITKEQLI